MTKAELTAKLIELASQYDDPWEPVQILAEIAYEARRTEDFAEDRWPVEV
ncbi:hypothetical protein [Synechococcus sp. PCC 7336]|nr:hypothetical protein [Synechococcus sp. PCC 7336]